MTPTLVQHCYTVYFTGINQDLRCELWEGWGKGHNSGIAVLTQMWSTKSCCWS